MNEYLFSSKRLGLRNWKKEDIIPFIEMCQDFDVMRFFPKTLSQTEAEQFIQRMQSHFNQFGFCYFAIEEIDTKEFIGFTGLLHQNYESPFTPCIDIGWRLKKSAWGKGFATEAAKATLDFAKNHINSNEIYSIAPKINSSSISVMKKIGMQYHSTFQHPALKHHPRLQTCEVYKIYWNP